ncbi:MAG: hypothetical protein P8J32_03670 [bacterium]|nr:hypothetical protein [bacterium]
MKECVLCKKELDESKFSKNKTKKDGLNYSCKKCHSEYRKQKYKENREKEIAQVRKYKKDNPDKYDYSQLTPLQRKTKSGRNHLKECGYCKGDVYVTKRDLNEGRKRYCSSGCYHAATGNDAYDDYINGIRKRAVKKKLDFNLDKEFLIDLLEVKQKGLCSATRNPISVKKNSEKSVLYETASLDRINNNQGYVRGNVQWVMLGVNYMKLNFTEEDLHKTLALIKENYKPQ